MKKLFFCAIAILNITLAQAQSKDRDVIAGSGGYINTPVAIVSYTLGETAIQYLSAPRASLSQGFQQDNNAGTLIKGVNSLDAVVSTFPNPFVSFVEIKTDRILNGAIFQLAGATGKMIQIAPVEIVKGKHWHIEVTNLAAGNYWLSIIADGKNGSYVLTHITP